MKHNDENNSAAIGCMILTVGGAAFIGGLLYFVRFVIILIRGSPL